jgi:hypothetical protein
MEQEAIIKAHFLSCITFANTTRHADVENAFVRGKRIQAHSWIRVAINTDTDKLIKIATSVK